MFENYMPSEVGPIEVTGAAVHLRDEVLGKLVHSNIVVSMDSVGFTPVALSALPKEDGSMLVFYAVRLSAAELAALPSIYDTAPKPARKRRK